jgi:excisionase family DNA binding protein
MTELSVLPSEPDCNQYQHGALLTTGNTGLDALADAIAERVLARLHQGKQPRLLTVNEAAAHIGRTAKALRHMIASGAIPAVREGSRVHLDRADLDRWVEMRRVWR